ncbi:PD-(D/E)XK nuclease family protein [Halomonas sp. LBP4]|uniref:PD-(D/E)XK nuclease family protein n=1 Tax=Halomonas sp. LBP4 TaxID=2044917 RepID=UPI000D766D5A|nr:PD-(D/E)XK nuclease family protein [Halomonas sp. LBP4]PXX95941.1 hypothetical protein CR157_17260 [Halomonas sp. LBP4]
MGPELFTLFLVLALGVTLIDAISRRVFGKRVHWTAQERMPRELQLGKLVMSESPISTQYPVALHGTPDQVFLNHKGVLVPVDTKLRRDARTTGADRLQLSVYATILAHTRSEPVASYGYVRVVTSGRRPRYRKVWLLPDGKVVAKQRAMRSAAARA